MVETYYLDTEWFVSHMGVILGPGVPGCILRPGEVDGGFALPGKVSLLLTLVTEAV